MQDLEVRAITIKSDLAFIGSQWKEERIGVIWQNDLVLVRSNIDR